MRSWLVFRLLNWCLWLDTPTTLKLAIALSAENARRQLAERGLHLVPDENGMPVLEPINPDPTVH